MGDKDRGRSGVQTAADLSRAARAALRIAKAAAAAGLKGAAVATVKESLPFLCKLAIGLIVALLVLTMVVFTTVPSIFFGFQSNNGLSQPVVEMTQKALDLGGVFMELTNVRSSLMDAVITSLAGEYEAEGTSIDRFDVRNTFGDDDLAWFIAIHCAANQQELNAMSAESIKVFCVFCLRRAVSICVEDEVTILRVHIGGLSPEAIMAGLGFDEEQKAWARTLHETLVESDALNQYRAYYTGYGSDDRDPLYEDNLQHGSGYDNAIDTSRFVSPRTKNNLDLVEYAVQAWENNWGYVWGTYGNVLTSALLEYKLEQYPDGVGRHIDFIRANWLGRRTTDCVGLIKGYGWLDVDTMKFRYGSNGMPDYGANTMHRAAIQAGVAGRDYGPMSTMPEIPGLAVWKDGHIGVYIGNGYVIEASGTRMGVIKTQVQGRGWSEWRKIPYISYLNGG